MTNRNPDVRNEDEVQALRLAFDRLKREVRVAMPGVVQSYDAETRRATVQPAISKTFRSDDTVMAQPLVQDVPVSWTGSPRVYAHAPLERGDPVMLIWSQRDFESFKNSFTVGAPASNRIMAIEDAYAIPWGPPGEIDPAVDNAFVMQTADGETYISIEQGRIQIKADAIRIEYDGGMVEYP